MIPNVAHFVWLGEQLPWVYITALRSARERGAFARVVLHMGASDSAVETTRKMIAQSEIEVRTLIPEQLLGDSSIPAGVLELYRKLESPVAMSNVLRVSILYVFGGVYLDADTITLQPFESLRTHEFFCGQERILLPGDVARNMTRSQWLRSRALASIRDHFRRKPRGYRGFRLVEGLYYLGVNLAVLGSVAYHPFLRKLLESMVTMAPEKQLTRYALGTHLLQETVANYTGEDLHICSPRVFYPLPPEISEHWFRFSKGASLKEVLSPETVVVHWYASVRTRDILPQIDAAYVSRHAGEQLFSALAQPFAW